MVARVEEVEVHPAYGSLAAAKKSKVFLVNDDLPGRPGPRIVESAREVANILHPDAFR